MTVRTAEGRRRGRGVGRKSVAFRHEIYLADDHEAVRIGVNSVLDGTEFVVVGQAATYDEVLALLGRAVPEALVTDLGMAGERFSDGVDFIRHLRDTYPDLPVLVLTMTRRPVLLDTLRRLGVHALIDKGSPLGSVPKALRHVLSGRAFVSESFATGKEGAIGESPTPGGTPALSQAEAQIVRLFAQGMGINDIALALDKSVSTVSTYKRRAMKKIGVNSNHDLRDYVRGMHVADGDSP